MSITDPSFSSIRNTIQWYDPDTKTWKNTILGNGKNGSDNVSSASIVSKLGNKSSLWSSTKGFKGDFSTFLLYTQKDIITSQYNQQFNTSISLDVKNILGFFNSLSSNFIKQDLAAIMGAFGYDSITKTSWAVIKHNSLYSGDDLGSSEIFDEAALNHTLSDPGLVSSDPNASAMTVQAVPEPETWALMLAGGVLLFLAGRSKKRERV
jgi:hypothetical protein